MEVLLIIAVVVVGILALLLVSRYPREEDARGTELIEAGRHPDQQFRRPPNEGDLL